jgi:hypothetical protein
MRKIAILILTIFSLGFYAINTMAAERVHIKLNNQIGIAFINQNMLLVMEKKQSTLLVLDQGSLDNLNKFNYRNLSVLSLKKTSLKVKSNNKKILKNKETIGDVTYTIDNGLININYKGSNLCIYTGGTYNIDTCQFIYFHNPNVSDLTVYDYNEIVLYYYKKPLSKNIQEKIYEQSIDTYPIRDDELTIIRLSADDYDFIVINND